jgi:flagellar secretion chaperone FliS
MFHAASNPIGAYQDVGIDTSVRDASPHQLIVLLLAGARQTLLVARGGIEQKNIPLKGSAISKGIDIILNGLRASLDQEKGGEIAVNLGALYDFMARRLLHANMNNDIGALDEVLGLLTEIQEAWEAIGVNSNGKVRAGTSSQVRARP